jgi:hypothetical protein
MTVLLSLRSTPLIWRRGAIETIGQECDRTLTRACEISPSPTHDSDLVLLADAGIGHEDIA